MLPSLGRSLPDRREIVCAFYLSLFLSSFPSFSFRQFFLFSLLLVRYQRFTNFSYTPTIYLSPDFLIKIRGHVDNSDRVVFHKAIRTLIFRGDFSSFVTFTGTNASFPLRV